MRLLSGQDSASGWENDRQGTLASLRKLGLHDADGGLNLTVLKAFGNIAQQTYLSAELDHARMYEELHRRFPGMVEPPQAESDSAA